MKNLAEMADGSAKRYCIGHGHSLGGLFHDFVYDMRHLSQLGHLTVM